MKVGDIVSIYYNSDAERRIDLGTGLIVGFGNDISGEDLIFILKPDGSVEEYSRNIHIIKFNVINETG